VVVKKVGTRWEVTRHVWFPVGNRAA